MKMVHDPTHTIHIPLSGYVDVSGMEAIVNHALFGKLRFRRQLGWSLMVKAGGVHTRFEHSIGTMHIARQMMQRFAMSPDDAMYRALETYALLHDIGHGPTSHELEYVLPDNHDDNGVHRIVTMKNAIETYADFQTVQDLMAGKHEWSVLVKHKTIGADKIDYLQRDAHHIGYEIAMNSGRLISCLQYRDGTFGVDEEAKEEVMTNMFNYLRMYLSVYLHPSVKLYARMYQRALTEKLAQSDLEPNVVWDWVDFQIESLLSEHPLMQRIIVRGQMDPAASFRVKNFEREEHEQQDVAYPVTGVDVELLKLWSKEINDPHRVIALEREIERMHGLPEHSVLIVQTDLFDRLAPQDVQIYLKRSRRFRSLFELVPTHRDELIRRGHRAFTIRIMTLPEYQAKLAKVDFHSWLTESLNQQQHLFKPVEH